MNEIFGINVYRDREMVNECLVWLRRSYPHSRVLLISDGDGVDYSEIAARHRAEFLAQPERLRPHPTGNRWWNRFLSILGRYNADYYVRLDPDTRFLRPVRFWPDDVGSDLRRLEGLDYPLVTGGCVSFTARSLARILASDLLYVDNHWTDDRYGMTWLAGETLSFGDRIISEVLHTLGQRVRQTAEVGLCWKCTTPSEMWPRLSVISVERTGEL